MAKHVLGKIQIRGMFHRVAFSAVKLVLPLSFGVISYAQKAPVPNFVQYSATIGGSPALGVYANTALYLAYRSNDQSSTLWVTSSTDGVTLSTPVHFANIILGSDPSISGDVPNNQIQVAFKSPVNDSLTVCSIALPLVASSPTYCLNLPVVHMLRSPSLLNDSTGANAGSNYVAYQTSAGDSNGAGHLGLLTFRNSSYNGHSYDLQTVLPTMMLGTPSIEGYGGSVSAPYNTLNIAFAANDGTRRLMVQSVSANFRTYNSPTLFSDAVLSGPVISPVTGTELERMVAFRSTNNGYVEFLPINGRDSTTFSAGTLAQNPNTTISAPSVISWTPQTGQYANVKVFSAAFQGSNTNLYFGSQSFQ